MEATGRQRGSSDSRRGIALVIVLGFLSVLVVMAVALMTLTRTERLVAAYSLEGERARHILLGAIYSAVEDLGVDLESSGDFHPTKDRAVFESWLDDFDPHNGGPNLVELLEGEVTNWIPRRFLSGADPDFDAETIWENDARWFLVFDPEEDAQGRHRILGRYAYLVLDCNGMLDANLVTNLMTTDPSQYPRGFGTNLFAEVDYGRLEEVVSDDALWANLAYYHRFATLPEIIRLNDGASGIAGWTEQAAIQESKVSNLMPYSFAYDNGYWGGTDFVLTNGDGSISLPGGGSVPADPTDWTRVQAEQAFEAAGYDVGTAEVLAYMWQDYLDEDFQPSGPGGDPDPDYVSCEPIPMINEIGVRYRLLQQGDGLGEIDFIHRVVVELWYPFPGVNNGLGYTVTVQADAGSFAFRARYRDTSGSWHRFNFTPDTGVKSAVPSPVIPGQGNIFLCVTAQFVHVYSPPEEVTEVEVRSQVRGLTVEVVQDADVVDRSSPGSFLTTPKVTISAGGDSGELLAGNSWQALDPRINHESADWFVTLRTLGELNQGLGGFNVSANGAPEGTNMYCRNGSDVINVGEMGFLPTGEPWTTVDLFSEEGEKLMAMFRVGGYRGETNGLVNPNTFCTSVLNAIFWKVPIDEWPVDPPEQRLEDASAISHLVDDIVSVAATGSFYSRAGWVTVPALQPGGRLASAGYNNCQRDAIIRNSVGLFNAHQNLYTVIVVAQAVKDRGDVGEWKDGEDVVTAEKRAAALVWRDPFPNAQGHHETFIRVFRYLTE